MIDVKLLPSTPMSFLRSSLKCNTFSSNALVLASHSARRSFPITTKYEKRTLGTSSEVVEDTEEARKLRERHVAHRQTMKEKFPDGWNPPRKISREAMQNLRALHSYNPQAFSTPVLAHRFRISPEAVRRILKSKWAPSKREQTKIMEKERRRKGEYIAKSIARELSTASKD